MKRSNEYIRKVTDMFESYNKEHLEEFVEMIIGRELKYFKVK